MIRSASAPGTGRPSGSVPKWRRLPAQHPITPGNAGAGFQLHESAQMVGHKSGVEQDEASRDQSGDQMHQRDLRRVPHDMEHALPKERAAEPDAIEAAREMVILRTSTLLTMAEFVQTYIEFANTTVDPGIVASRLWRGAGPSITASKAVSTVTVKLSDRTVRASRDGTRKLSSGMTPRIFGSTQKSVGSSDTFRHRKNAAGISAQQQFGRDLGRGGIAGHPESYPDRALSLPRR